MRVVCSNTLSVALSGSEEEVRIRHTPNAVENLAEAHKLLGLSNQLYEQLDYIFNRMALKKVTDKQLVEYVEKLVPDNRGGGISTLGRRTSGKRSSISTNRALGQRWHGDTLWGALQLRHRVHGPCPARHESRTSA